MVKAIFRYFFFLFISFFSTSFLATAQYYYKDILSNQHLNKEFSILKKAQVKTIKITSFEDNNEPSEGFFCEKKINKNYTQSEMISKSYITGQALLVTDYNADGKVTKTTNTTPTTTNTTEYEYDQNGNLSLVRTYTSADDDSSGITETHTYSYSENGKPEKMLRKKNNILISTITFLKDDKGNIIEEDAAGNTNHKKYYYYYDEQNRLTDVVHFNELAKKLLPDYMFEYANTSQPKQMISVDESGRNYFIWRYSYDDKNLPEIQKCYSKEKRLLGTIQYEYL
jgi:YD repeat-containing protein